MKAKTKTLALLLAATLAAGSVSAQVPGATNDTVKLAFVDPNIVPNGASGSFAVQILVTLEKDISGGNLGFAWSDQVNWRYDSTVFGPALLVAGQTLITDSALSNSLGAVLVGWVDFPIPTPNPILAGTDILWGTMYFTEKTGSTWGAGSQMLIDSIKVPPGGDFVLTRQNDPTTPIVSPNFTGAKLVTFNDVGDDGEALPLSFGLHQNYPNPFNPTTKILFDTPVKGRVEISVYNALGQHVVTLLDEEREAGANQVVEWSGENASGAKVASGMYFYKITAGDFVRTRKMLMVK
ncbi:MAG: T9SS type A sorting domain-containing protein [Candidatus Zixiibacteriota bacterium]